MVDQLILMHFKSKRPSDIFAGITWCVASPVQYLPEALFAPMLSAEDRQLRAAIFVSSTIDSAAHRAYLHRYRWPITDLSESEMLVMIENICISGDNQILKQYPSLVSITKRLSDVTSVLKACQVLLVSKDLTPMQRVQNAVDVLCGVIVSQEHWLVLIKSALDTQSWQIVRELWDHYPDLAHNNPDMVQMIMRHYQVPDQQTLQHPAMAHDTLVQAAIAFFQDETSGDDTGTCMQFANAIPELQFHVTYAGNAYLSTPADAGLAFWTTRICGAHALHFTDSERDVCAYHEVAYTMRLDSRV